MERSQRNRLLALVFLSQTFSFASTLLPSLLSEGGRLSAVYSGLVIALASLLSGFWQPLMGTWLDRGQVLRAFWVVFAGYTAGIAAFFFPSNTTSFVVLGALSLVMAHVTCRTLIAMALVARFKGEARAEAATMRYFVSNAALAVAALIAMTSFKEYRQELLIADWATTLILAAGISYRLRRDGQQNEGNKVPFGESLALLKSAFANNGRRILGLNLITLGFGANMSYLPLLISQQGGDSVKVNSISLLINTVIIILLLKPMQKLTKKWSEQRVGLVSASLIGVGLAFAPLFGESWLLYVGIVLWTVGELIYLPWEQVQLFNCFPDSQPGLASGAISFLMSVVYVLAPLLGSALLTLTDGAAATILFVLPFIGFVLFRDSGLRKMKEDELRLAS